jgi:hypothetical protein
MQSNLEKELKEWRESRSRQHAAISAERHKTFSAPSENRRVRVNGQEVLVVSKSKKPLA